MAEVVIAVRGGPDAKSRCGDAAGCAQLVEAMLSDMLDAVAKTTRFRAVHVVTPTSSVASLARARGVNVIFEAAPAGLNEAFESARAVVCATHPQEAICFLPGDLPLLNPVELEQAVAAYSTDAVVISPATADGGTGALIVRADMPFAFRFGPDSFRRHVAAAHATGLLPRFVTAASLGFDLDRPTDVKALLALNAGGRTSRFLASLSMTTAAA